MWLCRWVTVLNASKECSAFILEVLVISLPSIAFIIKGPHSPDCWRHNVPCKQHEPITHWCGIILQKKRILNIFPYFVLWPTNAQLFHKLSHCYMFRHYHVFLRELVINTLPSYTSMSHTKCETILICITNKCIWNTCVTWQGTDYKLPEDDTTVSKHVGGVW